MVGRQKTIISDKYYYNKFLVHQQVLYKKIYDAVSRYDEYIICGEHDYTEDDFSTILNAVIMDNSDIFYVRNNIYIEKTSWGLVKLYPQYYFEKKDKEQIEVELEKCAYQLFDSIDIQKKDHEEISKEVHDFLITKTIIDEMDEIPEIEKCAVTETLLENKMTMRGNAYTYKYLLNLLGIKCNIIKGCYNGVNDRTSVCAWNCINLYGKDRYVDVFGDAKKSTDQKICYDYFGITDEILLKDHSIMTQTPVRAEKNVTNEKKAIQVNACTPDQENEELLNIDSLKVDEIIRTLNDIPSNMQSDVVGTIIEKLVQQLKILSEVENQYPEEKEHLENGILNHFPDLLRILCEYYRYKKYSASSNLVNILYEKLSMVIETIMKTIQYNINLFWNHHTNEIISDINGIQKNLINEKKNRKPCPINIDELNEESDISDFIIVLQYLKLYGLPQKINKQIVQILDDLNNLQETMRKSTNKTIQIDSLKSYYLPEAIQLIFHYDKYEDDGMSKKRLDELDENIQNSLSAVRNAINSKLDEIYMFETMETKARAKALADIIGQDGYVINHDFEIKGKKNIS